MKQSITTSVLVFAFCLLIGPMALGQNLNASDSLFAAQQRQIDNLSKVVTEIQSQTSKNTKAINDVKSLQEFNSKSIDELGASLSDSKAELSHLSEALGGRIDETQQKVESSSTSLHKNIKNTSIFGIIIALLLILVLFFVYYFLRRKISQSASTIDTIHKAQQTLQEESIKLDEKLVGLLDRKLEKKLPETNSAPDHSLALKIADEIIRIETNLSRMDSSVRGHKQLSASVRRIKDNFAANGYELIDMLGKPYNDGMKVIANFVPDDTLKEGEQIITGIIKPQINFNGEMIQAAQITVSQNI